MMHTYGDIMPEHGRWETVQPVTVAAGVAVAQLVPGDGTRVRLIVSAALVPSSVASQFVDIGIVFGASFFPIVRLSGEAPSAILRLEDVGDLLWGALSMIAEAAHNVTATGVRYHPFIRE